MTRAFVLAALGAALLSACAGNPKAPPSGRNLVEQIVVAHGGHAAWDQIRSVSVQRRHEFVQPGAKPFVFSIEAEYGGGGRMVQRWQQPAGSLCWDGTSARALDWPLAERLLPEFVMSIGFYLVNMPWLMAQPGADVAFLGTGAVLLADDPRRYLALRFRFNAPMLRGGPAVAPAADYFDVFVDPQTYLIAGIHQHRRWPAQLEKMGQGPDGDFFEIFIPTMIEVGPGLRMPGRYEVFTGAGQRKTFGEFSDYRFDEPIAYAPPC